VATSSPLANYNQPIFSKSSGDEDELVAGVVALGSSFQAAGHLKVQYPDFAHLMALAGRVPVKVTSEFGDIEVGDAIKASSIPGFGTKAVESGRIVGYALGDVYFKTASSTEVATGTVMALIQPGYIGSSLAKSSKGRQAVEIREASTSTPEVFVVRGDARFEGRFGIIAPSSTEVFIVDPVATTTPTVVIRSHATGTPALRVEGDIVLRGQGTVAGAATSSDSVTGQNMTDGSDSNDTEVRLRVVQSDVGTTQLVVGSSADFAGEISVIEAVVTGHLVVTNGLSVTGNFELSGAIIQPFEEAEGEYLQIGDAVTVVDDGVVGLTYADRPEFRPAIGIVVGIEDIGGKSYETYSSSSGEGGDNTATTTQDVPDKSNKPNSRTVKVAIGGVVGGFEELVPGSRYFLSDISAYSDRQAVTSTLPSLIPSEPSVNGAAIQVVGLAKSASELIVNPSFEWRIVGEDNSSGDAPIYVNQYNVDNIIIGDSNNQDTDASDQNSNDQSSSDNSISDTATSTEEVTDDPVETPNDDNSIGDTATSTDEVIDSGSNSDGADGNISEDQTGSTETDSNATSIEEVVKEKAVKDSPLFDSPSSMTSEESGQAEPVVEENSQAEAETSVVE